MAYNRTNLLHKVVEIQNITMTEKKRGATQTWIYANCIADRFHISYSTYNRYLGIPAKRDLKTINEENK